MQHYFVVLHFIQTLPCQKLDIFQRSISEHNVGALGLMRSYLKISGVCCIVISDPKVLVTYR
jgi:hypothetical protein